MAYFGPINVTETKTIKAIVLRAWRARFRGHYCIVYDH